MSCHPLAFAGLAVMAATGVLTTVASFLLIGAVIWHETRGPR